MKKILLGVIALAFVFTASAIINKKDDRKPTSSYYFYEVVNGSINPNEPLNSAPMTVEEFENSELLPCEVGSTTDCVRGWVNQIDATATGAADEVIRKD